jgi:hypothetical protein
MTELQAIIDTAFENRAGITRPTPIRACAMRSPMLARGHRSWWPRR